jgi:hypothetical protein
MLISRKPPSLQLGIQVKDLQLPAVKGARTAPAATWCWAMGCVQWQYAALSSQHRGGCWVLYCTVWPGDWHEGGLLVPYAGTASR